ncbi:MAG: hypothetical protein K2Q03_06910 [Sphingobacteriaceae bacterium]|nr:hypothetical protein [Sphingobacteriaceae bacterium]
MLWNKKQSKIFLFLLPACSAEHIVTVFWGAILAGSEIYESYRDAY